MQNIPKIIKVRKILSLILKFNRKIVIIMSKIRVLMVTKAKIIRGVKYERTILS